MLVREAADVWMLTQLQHAAAGRRKVERLRQRSESRADTGVTASELQDDRSIFSGQR